MLPTTATETIALGKFPQRFSSMLQVKGSSDEVQAPCVPRQDLELLKLRLSNKQLET